MDSNLRIWPSEKTHDQPEMYIFFPWSPVLCVYVRYSEKDGQDCHLPFQLGFPFESSFVFVNGFLREFAPWPYKLPWSR